MSSGNKMPDAGGFFWIIMLGLAIFIVGANLGGCVWTI